MADTTKAKAHCNLCRGDRWHYVLFTKDHDYEECDEETGTPYYHERHKYSVMECCGCENVTFVDEIETNAQHGAHCDQYPPRMDRHMPKWIIHIVMQGSLTNPYKYDLLHEIYGALKNNMPRLAVMGVRALIEQVMIENVGDKGTFDGNLTAFTEQGFISPIQRGAIKPVIEAGHASIHRGFKATNQEIEVLMDITENILESIYVTKQLATKVTAPPRAKTQGDAN